MTITTYPNNHLLADVTWINDHLLDENLTIIDARTNGYEAGHIPGAISISTERLVDQNNKIAGFLLQEDDFTTLFQSTGLNQHSTVLVYDEGFSLNAARIFYALEYYGLQNQIKILNGGYLAWLHEGYPITTAVKDVIPGNFVAQANTNLISTRKDIEESLHSDDFIILDTRSKNEYKGNDLRNNQKGGHIPGAVHLEWTEAMMEDNYGFPQFLNYEELTSKFEQIGVVKNKTIVPYCQSNVRASNTYLSLRLLGYSNIRPYEGSWAEWGNRADTEVEL